VRRFLSRKEIRRRLEALEARLGQPTPPPLEGQQALDLIPRYEQPTLEEDDQQ
jgi:hypothetical protein